LHGKPLAATPKTSALTVYSVVRAILTRKLKLLIGCQSGKGQTGAGQPRASAGRRVQQADGKNVLK